MTKCIDRYTEWNPYTATCGGSRISHCAHRLSWLKSITHRHTHTHTRARQIRPAYPRALTLDHSLLNVSALAAGSCSDHVPFHRAGYRVSCFAEAGPYVHPSPFAKKELFLAATRVRSLLCRFATICKNSNASVSIALLRLLQSQERIEHLLPTACRAALSLTSGHFMSPLCI